MTDKKPPAPLSDDKKRPPPKPVMFRFQAVNKEELQGMYSRTPLAATNQPRLPGPTLPTVPTRPPVPTRPTVPTRPPVPVTVPATSYRPRPQPSRTPSTSSAAYRRHEAVLPQQLEEYKKQNQPVSIELPEDSKLVTYRYVANGVERTLLVPVPVNATAEDVRKLLVDKLDGNFVLPEYKAGEVIPVLNLDMQPGLSMEDAQVDDDSDQEEYEEGVESEQPLAPRTHNPVLVNRKQYNRIVQRRQMRLKLEQSGRIPVKRQKYMHESRHRHALSRKRDETGRFEFFKEDDDDDDEDEEDEEDEEESETDDDEEGSSGYALTRYEPIAAAPPREDNQPPPAAPPASSARASGPAPSGSGQPADNTVPVIVLN